MIIRMINEMKEGMHKYLNEIKKNTNKQQMNSRIRMLSNA
jgi:hypothetical protein